MRKMPRLSKQYALTSPSPNKKSKVKSLYAFLTLANSQKGEIQSCEIQTSVVESKKSITNRFNEQNAKGTRRCV